MGFNREAPAARVRSTTYKHNINFVKHFRELIRVMILEGLARRV